MKKIIAILIVSSLFGCAKEPSEEVKHKPDPITAYEQSFVGKWNWIKTENRSSTGSLLSVIVPSSSFPYNEAFINITAINYGDENHKYIEKYGNGTAVGITTRWWIEGTNIICSTYPNQVTSPHLKKITSDSLVIGEYGNTSGFTIYYTK